MREKREWHSLKVWDETYQNLKVAAALRGRSLAELLDAMAHEELQNASTDYVFRETKDVETEKDK